MEYEQDNISGSGEAGVKKVQKRSGWRVFWRIFTGLSVLGNILLLLLLMAVSVAFVFGAGQSDGFVEDVIQAGPKTAKVVVINLKGIIAGGAASDIYKQLKAVGSDGNVKGVILRIDSPGGLVSSSDQIYNELRKYRAKTGKPVVAFMQGVAASGGYYAAVGCDEIVAEPTVITGSIGVIMNYFVFEELLEKKLGILPVVSKSGLRKDWPSPFEAPSAERRAAAVYTG